MDRKNITGKSKLQITIGNQPTCEVNKEYPDLVVVLDNPEGNLNVIKSAPGEMPTKAEVIVNIYNNMKKAGRKCKSICSDEKKYKMFSSTKCESSTPKEKSNKEDGGNDFETVMDHSEASGDDLSKFIHLPTGATTGTTLRDISSIRVDDLSTTKSSRSADESRIEEISDITLEDLSKTGDSIQRESMVENIKDIVTKFTKTEMSNDGVFGITLDPHSTIQISIQRSMTEKKIEISMGHAPEEEKIEDISEPTLADATTWDNSIQHSTEEKMIEDTSAPTLDVPSSSDESSHPAEETKIEDISEPTLTNTATLDSLINYTTDGKKVEDTSAPSLDVPSSSDESSHPMAETKIEDISEPTFTNTATLDISMQYSIEEKNIEATCGPTLDAPSSSEESSRPVDVFKIEDISDHILNDLSSSENPNDLTYVINKIDNISAPSSSSERLPHSKRERKIDDLSEPILADTTTMDSSMEYATEENKIEDFSSITLDTPSSSKESSDPSDEKKIDDISEPTAADSTMTDTSIQYFTEEKKIEDISSFTLDTSFQTEDTTYSLNETKIDDISEPTAADTTILDNSVEYSTGEKKIEDISSPTLDVSSSSEESSHPPEEKKIDDISESALADTTIFDNSIQNSTEEKKILDFSALIPDTPPSTKGETHNFNETIIKDIPEPKFAYTTTLDNSIQYSTEEKKIEDISSFTLDSSFPTEDATHSLNKTKIDDISEPSSFDTTAVDSSIQHENIDAMSDLTADNPSTPDNTLDHSIDNKIDNISDFPLDVISSTKVSIPQPSVEMEIEDISGITFDDLSTSRDSQLMTNEKNVNDLILPNTVTQNTSSQVITDEQKIEDISSITFDNISSKYSPTQNATAERNIEEISDLTLDNSAISEISMDPSFEKSKIVEKSDMSEPTYDISMRSTYEKNIEDISEPTLANTATYDNNLIPYTTDEKKIEDTSAPTLDAPSSSEESSHPVKETKIEDIPEPRMTNTATLDSSIPYSTEEKKIENTSASELNSPSSSEESSHPVEETKIEDISEPTLANTATLDSSMNYTTDVKKIEDTSAPTLDAPSSSEESSYPVEETKIDDISEPILTNTATLDSSIQFSTEEKKIEDTFDPTLDALSSFEESSHPMEETKIEDKSDRKLNDFSTPENPTDLTYDIIKTDEMSTTSEKNNEDISDAPSSSVHLPHSTGETKIEDISEPTLADTTINSSIQYASEKNKIEDISFPTLDALSSSEESLHPSEEKKIDDITESALPDTTILDNSEQISTEDKKIEDISAPVLDIPSSSEKSSLLDEKIEEVSEPTSLHSSTQNATKENKIENISEPTYYEPSSSEESAHPLEEMKIEDLSEVTLVDTSLNTSMQYFTEERKIEDFSALIPDTPPPTKGKTHNFNETIVEDIPEPKFAYTTTLDNSIQYSTEEKIDNISAPTLDAPSSPEESSRALEENKIDDISEPVLVDTTTSNNSIQHNADDEKIEDVSEPTLDDTPIPEEPRNDTLETNVADVISEPVLIDTTSSNNSIQNNEKIEDVSEPTLDDTPIPEEPRDDTLETNLADDISEPVLIDTTTSNNSIQHNEKIEDISEPTLDDTPIPEEPRNDTLETNVANVISEPVLIDTTTSNNSIQHNEKIEDVSEPTFDDTPIPDEPTDHTFKTNVVPAISAIISDAISKLDKSPLDAEQKKIEKISAPSLVRTSTPKELPHPTEEKIEDISEPTLDDLSAIEQSTFENKKLEDVSAVTFVDPSSSEISLVKSKIEDFSYPKFNDSNTISSFEGVRGSSTSGRDDKRSSSIENTDDFVSKAVGGSQNEVTPKARDISTIGELIIDDKSNKKIVDSSTEDYIINSFFSMMEDPNVSIEDLKSKIHEISNKNGRDYDDTSLIEDCSELSFFDVSIFEREMLKYNPNFVSELLDEMPELFIRHLNRKKCGKFRMEISDSVSSIRCGRKSFGKVKFLTESTFNVDSMNSSSGEIDSSICTELRSHKEILLRDVTDIKISDSSQTIEITRTESDNLVISSNPLKDNLQMSLMQHVQESISGSGVNLKISKVGSADSFDHQVREIVLRIEKKT